MAKLNRVKERKMENKGLKNKILKLWTRKRCFCEKPALYHVGQVVDILNNPRMKRC